MRMPIVVIFVSASIIGCNPEVRVYGNGNSGGSSGSTSSSSSGGTGGSGGGVGGSGGSSSSSSGGSVRYAALPVAPGSGNFMWQGVQNSFVDDQGNPCNAHIAIAAGDTSVCYSSAGAMLRCSGKIFDRYFGPAFVDIPDVGEVEQILMSPTVNAADHQGLCVRTRPGQAYCFGNSNDHGQYGYGIKGATPGFKQWGPVDGIMGIATGTWDQICGLLNDGTGACAGNGFDTSPIVVVNGASQLWVDTFAVVNSTDFDTLRAINSRTECQVTPVGLRCSGGKTYGPSNGSAVVDGTMVGYLNAPNAPSGTSRYCWLGNDGKVECMNVLNPGPADPPYTVFDAQPVLAIAGNYYSSTLCAVYADGSIACMGSNNNEQLGMPAAGYVEAPVIVQPPGSVNTVCD